MKPGTFRPGAKPGPGRPSGAVGASERAKRILEQGGGWARMRRIALGTEDGFGTTLQSQMLIYLANRAYGSPHQSADLDVNLSVGLADRIAEARKQVSQP